MWFCFAVLFMII